MGRLGVWHEEAHALAHRSRAPRASGSRASSPTSPVPTRPPSPWSSAGVSLRRFPKRPGPAPAGPAPGPRRQQRRNRDHARDSPFNAVRVGLLQFGILPHASSLLAQVRTETVFSFHTRVGIVKRLPSGTTVSYGRTRRLAGTRRSPSCARATATAFQGPSATGRASC